MNIQHVILGFLTEKPMSGYDIKQMMENSVAYFFDASYGAIYPALKRMEKEAFIEKEVVQQEGKPNKNLYVITNRGKEEFLSYMESPLNPTLIRSDLLIRIFFGRYTSKENITSWLKKEEQKAKNQLEHLNQINEKYPNMDSFKKMTLLYGIDSAQFTLKWIENELAKLRKGDE
ncbi:PadR family transcriptional regulator [Bacillus sp. RG28]|uniref:PadR family transcriptional regulator n=1 Tax=Gottfriedia endophytica TaxID=2820819 RepID=A0A940NMA2_9BACI|nr:PadR family transcriptional regulator [Gottfriedia endophytica]MBP0724140.1 PadR family transcriptional regulator [Gottfriedia endophytica]